MIPIEVRSIPFFNYPRLFLDEETALVDIFRDVGRRGAHLSCNRIWRGLRAILRTTWGPGTRSAWGMPPMG